MTTIADLSTRHRQVLELIARGHTDREIAAALGISCQTARHHAQALYAAIGLAGGGNKRSRAAEWYREHARKTA
jgi:DNA-binding NarL/FixJ family response regulator